MAAYRFRIHGHVFGVHFLSLDSDGDAVRYGDTMLGDLSLRTRRSMVGRQADLGGY